MVIQDIILMVGLLGLGAFAIPSIFSTVKPSKLMAVTYTLILAVLSVSLATLGLWLAAGAQAFCTVAWGILAIQRRKPNVW